MSDEPLDILKEIYDKRDDLGSVVEILTSDRHLAKELATQKCKKYSKYGIKGDSPLHIAMKHGTGNLPNLVKELLTICPDGAKETNDEGDLPIHRLHAKNASDSEEVFEAISLILEAYPESLNILCSRERLPFSQHIMSAKVARHLIENYPEWVKTEDGLGNLPLHWACKSGNLEAVQMCVDAYPDGLEHENRYEHLPLRYAVLTDDPKIVEIVSGKYPKAATVLDTETGLLPIVSAKSPETVSVLAKTCPEVFGVTLNTSRQGDDTLKQTPHQSFGGHPILQYLEHSNFDKVGIHRVQLMLEHCSGDAANDAKRAKIKDLEDALSEMKKSHEEALHSHRKTQQMLVSLQNILQAKMSEDDLISKVLEGNNVDELTMDDLKAVLLSLTSRLARLKFKMQLNGRMSRAHKLAKFTLSSIDGEVDREDFLEVIFDINTELMQLEPKENVKTETVLACFTPNVASFLSGGIVSKTKPTANNAFKATFFQLFGGKKN